MACIPIPKVPTPTLPFPLSIEPPTLPSFSGDLALCCKLVQFNLVPPPIPLAPLVLNPAAVAIIFTTIDQVNAYLRSLEIKCPKED